MRRISWSVPFQKAVNGTTSKTGRKDWRMVSAKMCDMMEMINTDDEESWINLGRDGEAI